MTKKVKPVDLSDEQIDHLEKLLMIELDPENAVLYFIESSNLRHAAAKERVIQFDIDDKIIRCPDVVKAEQKIENIRLHYKEVRKKVRRLLKQAKIANELHKNLCWEDI